MRYCPVKFTITHNPLNKFHQTTVLFNMKSQNMLRFTKLPVSILIFVLTVFSLNAQVWEYAPLVSKAQRDAGYIGGEGGQWLQALAIDHAEGKIMLHGSDVGGIWRSINGGYLWEPANNGYTPRGTCGLFIDPNNPGRAIAVGSNSQKAAWDNYHGLYLSTDTARTWTQVLPDNACGYRDIREQIAYDPSSFSAELGYSMIIYYSRIAHTASSEGGSGTLASGLYKSVDGGSTWKLIPDSKNYGSSILKVHHSRGYVFAANTNGFYRSTDQGATFSTSFEGNVKGFDISPADPSKVFLCTTNKIYISSDTGLTFQPVTSTGFTAYANYLRVSPVNSQYMITQHYNPSDPWNTYYLYSHNGGINWTKSSSDNSLDFLPRNFGRLMYPTWHPTGPDTLFAVGGDFITRSVNGGGSLVWANNGASAIMSRGNMSFNLDNPDLFFFSAQDYDASVSVDSGFTFKYLNMSGNGWGGDIHGGYIVDSLTWFGRKAEGWDDPSCDLKITFDGGVSYKTKGQSAGLPFCNGVPGDRNILFAGDLRSGDKGITWNRMTGCDGVITSNPSGNHEIFGVFNNSTIVQSNDKGITWEPKAVLANGIVDMAFDPVNNALYAACFTGGLWKVYLTDSAIVDLTNRTPADKYNVRRFSTVAVDLTNPEIVYFGGSRDIYSNDVGVIRSADGGDSWIPLTMDPRHNNPNLGIPAGRETTMIRVNPETGYAWCGSSCYGLWKIARPDSIPPPFPKIRLNQSRIVLQQNNEFKLKVTITNSYDTIIDWRSSNPDIVSVDQDGTVKALAPGSANITAESRELGLQASCQVVVAEPKAPFGGQVRQIPGIIQAEDFDIGGEGFAYHDASLANEGGKYRTAESVDIESCSEGGFNVGWTTGGEWLSYTVNVDSTMEYHLDLRAAVNTSSAISITFTGGNVSTGDISLAATGGWQSWKTFSVQGLPLQKGLQEMKVNVLNSGFNLNYIQLSRAIPQGIRNGTVVPALSVYPNPFYGGMLIIKTTGKGEPARVSIHSIDGKIVYSGQLTEENVIRIHRSYLDRGLYLIKYSDPEKHEMVKLIVE